MMVNLQHLKKGKTFGNFHDFKKFLPFLFEKLSKIHKIGDVGSLQKLSKFEENSKINNHSIVPQIDHVIAMCLAQIKVGFYVQ